MLFVRCVEKSIRNGDVDSALSIRWSQDTDGRSRSTERLCRASQGMLIDRRVIQPTVESPATFEPFLTILNWFWIAEIDTLNPKGSSIILQVNHGL